MKVDPQFQALRPSPNCPVVTAQRLLKIDEKSKNGDNALAGTYLKRKESPNGAGVRMSKETADSVMQINTFNDNLVANIWIGDMHIGPRGAKRFIDCRTFFNLNDGQMPHNKHIVCKLLKVTQCMKTTLYLSPKREWLGWGRLA